MTLDKALELCDIQDGCRFDICSLHAYNKHKEAPHHPLERKVCYGVIALRRNGLGYLLNKEVLYITAHYSDEIYMCFCIDRDTDLKGVPEYVI